MEILPRDCLPLEDDVLLFVTNLGPFLRPSLPSLPVNVHCPRTRELSERHLGAIELGNLVRGSLMYSRIVPI